ncbi:hypothetical protein Cgig2_013848 [Carnegiea gigantea]|uniref:PB1-like domain-containing protein n=1 Tax=Carnegiea gigantea TaxID=171969 RepID=A0A9Q1QJW9_9CARY|nr:hypothetical protein Cgig2_013848 [Carnegiea gigantea]
MDDAACKDAPVGGPNDVTLEINYGGVFEKGESVDADLLSYFEVKGLAEDVGFTNIEEIYYVIPWLSMEDGIRPLKTYFDSLDMAEYARKTKKIGAYIIHKVDEAVVIPPALPSCEAEKETCTSKEPKSVDRKRVKHVASKRTSPRGKVSTSNATHVTSKEKGPTTTVNNSGSNEKGPGTAGDVSATVASKLPKERVPLVSATVESAKEKVSPNVLVGGDTLSGSSRTSVYEPESDEWEDVDDDDDDDDVLETEEDVLEHDLHNVEHIKTSDENWEVANNNLGKFKEAREVEAQRAAAECRSEVRTACENDSEYEESDAELDTPPTTDEEDNMILRRRKKKKRVKINEHTDYKKLTWEVGMTFGTMEKFKEVVIRFALAQGYDLTFSVSDSKRRRLGAVCRSGYKFKFFASWEEMRATYVVKIVINHHPKIQQMPIPTQAQRGRGRLTSRRRGRGLGRGRGRATERGREGERIRTNISADNASTSGATSMVDVEAERFLSQASVGSSCLPQP